MVSVRNENEEKNTKIKESFKITLQHKKIMMIDKCGNVVYKMSTKEKKTMKLEKQKQINLVM